MDSERWPKTINYNVAGAYLKGCPKKQWLDNINNDMKSLKLNTKLVFEQNQGRKATQKKTYSRNASNPH